MASARVCTTFSIEIFTKGAVLKGTVFAARAALVAGVHAGGDVHETSQTFVFLSQIGDCGTGRPARKPLADQRGQVFACPPFVHLLQQ